MMHKGLFSEKMKLADMIHANYKLLYVFPRFGIKLNLGENTVSQVCVAKGISIPLFLMVCNLYTFVEYTPSYETLDTIPLNDLVNYLKNSHADYHFSRVPQISTKIVEMLNTGTIKHGEMLKQFCDNYEKELITHFDYEEKNLFPYINSLLQGNKTVSFSIEEFENNHTNIEEKLDDLKNILIKYLPEESFSDQCREVLIDLFLLEDDLNRHTLLEDKILVSLVERIENKEA